MKQNFVASQVAFKSFTVGASATNYDVKAQNATLWAGVTRPRGFKINTSATITIRINSISNDPIIITSTESTLELYLKDVTNVFITTTGASNIVFTLLG